MRKESRITRIVGCKCWKMCIFLLLISFVSIGCGGSDGGDSPTTPMTTSVTPGSGSWVGEDISFTVSEDAASISNFSVTYRGSASGTRCSFDYETTITLASGGAIANGSFSLSTTRETIVGTFTDANTATVQVSWSSFNSQCNADVSGSRTYSASHQQSQVVGIAKSSGYNSVVPTAVFKTADGMSGIFYEKLEQVAEIQKFCHGLDDVEQFEGQQRIGGING